MIQSDCGFILKRFDSALRPDFQAHHPTISNGLTRWWNLVYGYTGRSLTQDQDKLVAISTIAKQFQQLIDAEYLGGLWRHSLPLQLLWKVYPPPDGQVPRRTETYCAPTWSWASLIANVQLDWSDHNILQNDGENYMIQILECKVQPTSDDLHGQLSGGYLKIGGWVRSLRCFELRNVGENERMVHIQGEEVGFIYLDVAHYDRSDELYYMPVLETFIDGEPGTEIVGLVLVDAGIDGKYQRAGIFQSYASGTATGLSFLFKPPTYPRSASDLSAKLKLERFAAPSQNNGINNHSSFETTNSDNVKIPDLAEPCSPTRGGPRSEAMRAMSDTGTSAASSDSKGADKNSNLKLEAKDGSDGGEGSRDDEVKSNEDLSEEASLGTEEIHDFEDEEYSLNGEGGSHDDEEGSYCDEEKSNEDLWELVSSAIEKKYPFEDEEAWTEGVFEII